LNFKSGSKTSYLHEMELLSACSCNGFILFFMLSKLLRNTVEKGKKKCEVIVTAPRYIICSIAFYNEVSTILPLLYSFTNWEPQTTETVCYWQWLALS